MVDVDSNHAIMALDDGRVLGVGGEGVGDLAPLLAGDEDGVAGAGGRLRHPLGQVGTFSLTSATATAWPCSTVAPGRPMTVIFTVVALPALSCCSAAIISR